MHGFDMGCNGLQPIGTRDGQGRLDGIPDPFPFLVILFIRAAGSIATGQSVI